MRMQGPIPKKFLSLLRGQAEALSELKVFLKDSLTFQSSLTAVLEVRERRSRCETGKDEESGSSGA